MLCSIPRPSSAMGSIIKPIHKPGGTMIIIADLASVSVIDSDPDGKESITSR